MSNSIFRFLNSSANEKKDLVRFRRRIEQLEKEKKQRQKAEKSLRHHLRLLDVLLNTMHNPVFYQDNKGLLQGCNLSFSDLIFGLPRENMLGQSMTDLSSTLTSIQPKNFFRTHANPNFRFNPIQTEGRIRCADKRYHDFLLNTAFIAEPGGRVTGFVGVMVGITERKKAENEKEKLIGELKEALATVKTLSGLMPICSHCKKIRDDEGYWNQIEAYIEERSDAEFSHGICNDCAKKYYPEMDLYND